MAVEKVSFKCTNCKGIVTLGVEGGRDSLDSNPPSCLYCHSIGTLEYTDENLEGGKPVLMLTGLNGNAFNLLSAARKVALANGMNWQQIRDEAQAGDYDHLLQTLMKYFEVI